MPVNRYGIAKLRAFIVMLAVHVEHWPVGIAEESVPGLPGVSVPEEGDAR